MLAKRQVITTNDDGITAQKVYHYVNDNFKLLLERRDNNIKGGKGAQVFTNI